MYDTHDSLAINIVITELHLINVLGLFQYWRGGIYLRKLALDSDDYNIVEFILDRPDYREYTNIESNNAYTLDDYVDFLIEDAEKEFSNFTNSYF